MGKINLISARFVRARSAIGGSIKTINRVFRHSAALFVLDY